MVHLQFHARLCSHIYGEEEARKQGGNARKRDIRGRGSTHTRALAAEGWIERERERDGERMCVCVCVNGNGVKNWVLVRKTRTSDCFQCTFIAFLFIALTISSLASHTLRAVFTHSALCSHTQHVKEEEEEVRERECEKHVHTYT